MATVRPSSVSRARYTVPKEPTPSSSTSSNLPSRRTPSAAVAGGRHGGVDQLARDRGGGGDAGRLPELAQQRVAHAVERLQGRLAPRAVLDVPGDALEGVPGEGPQGKGGEFRRIGAAGRAH